MIENEIEALKAINPEEILVVIPRDLGESYKIATEWGRTCTPVFNPAEFNVVGDNYPRTDMMMFARCSTAMNAEIAEWFTNTFNIRSLNTNIPLLIAVHNRNLSFVQWYLKKFPLIKDRCIGRVVVDLIEANVNMDIINLMLENGTLQHCHMYALKATTKNMNEELIEFILNKCEFTDEEVESIPELPEKYKPLGLKSASKLS